MIIDLQDTQHFHTQLLRQSSENYAQSPFLLHAVTAQTDNQYSFCRLCLPLHWTFCLEFSNSYIVDSSSFTVFKSRLKTFLFRQTFTPSLPACLLLSTSATEVPRHTDVL